MERGDVLGVKREEGREYFLTVLTVTTILVPTYQDLEHRTPLQTGLKPGI